MYVSIFYCFLEPFSTYIKLYILSLNTGDLVHSIESKRSSSPFLFVFFFCLFFSEEANFYHKDQEQNVHTSLVDSEATWYLQRLAPLIRRELPASVHYHECPFLFILDKIEPLTLQSDIIQAYEVIRLIILGSLLVLCSCPGIHPSRFAVTYFCSASQGREVWCLHYFWQRISFGEN